MIVGAFGIISKNMDLNALFLRQQLETSRAEAANSDTARDRHRAAATDVEREITRRTEGRIRFHKKDE